MPSETWETPEKISAAQARFVRRIPGWTSPAAHGVVLVPASRIGSRTVRFPVANTVGHDLPAVVMALVTGRVNETATFEVSPEQLHEAIELLTPAEAAPMYRHPNIAAWRVMRERLRQDPSHRVFAVFVADLADPSSGPYDDALRAQIAATTGAMLTR
jgi:hypothetical protein